MCPGELARGPGTTQAVLRTRLVELAECGEVVVCNAGRVESVTR